MRTKRSSDSKTYEYVYSGDKLVQMTITDHTTSPETVQLMEFSYDAAGQPLTMTLDGVTYYYVLNIQGDVMGMVDGDGNLLYTMVYEGYGAGYYFSGGSAAAAMLLGTNPLGYRGYVMDAGTGLYYLQSRYYDPALGRFINADAYASTGQGLIGNNMFAYCLNNPANMVDPAGTCGYLEGTSMWLDCGRMDCPMSIYYFPITISIGISGSLTLGPFVFGVQIVLVTDSYGCSEIHLTYFLPLSSDAIMNASTTDEMLQNVASYEKLTDVCEFSLMGNATFYNTPSVKDLYGTGYQIGASLGAGKAVAVDYNIVPIGADSSYRGISISAGLGSTDIHASMGNTMRLMSSDVSAYDIIEAVYYALYGR